MGKVDEVAEAPHPLRGRVAPYHPALDFTACKGWTGEVGIDHSTVTLETVGLCASREACEHSLELPRVVAYDRDGKVVSLIDGGGDQAGEVLMEVLRGAGATE